MIWDLLISVFWANSRSWWRILLGTSTWSCHMEQWAMTKWGDCPFLVYRFFLISITCDLKQNISVRFIAFNLTTFSIQTNYLNWSSGYGWRLTFQRSWVRIPVPYTGWTGHFSHWFVVKNCIVCLKRQKINKKEAGIGPFKKTIRPPVSPLGPFNYLI